MPELDVLRWCELLLGELLLADAEPVELPVSALLEPVEAPVAVLLLREPVLGELLLRVACELPVLSARRARASSPRLSEADEVDVGRAPERVPVDEVRKLTPASGSMPRYSGTDDGRSFGERPRSWSLPATAVALMFAPALFARFSAPVAADTKLEVSLS